MSEEQDLDSANNDVDASEIETEVLQVESNIEKEVVNNNSDDNDTVENEQKSLDEDGNTEEESKETEETENCQDLSEEKDEPSSELEHQTSIEIKDRQSSIESKSHPSTWSFSQWSENYESLDDDKTVEDLKGDPQKMILWAAEKNEIETMRSLLEEDPNLINARDNDLYTPLHRASYSNNVEVIKLLLSYDVDICLKTADGWEALHCACKWDSVEAVSLLLQNGADVNAQTKGHITPLHLAASNVAGRRTLELLLWQPYIDPNIKNDAGDTAYEIACRTGPLGALFEILEESVNVY